MKLEKSHGGTPYEARIRQEIDPAEWEVRCNLAACYHLCDHIGLTDRINTHISARAPGNSEEFLLNPIGLLFDEVTASNLVRIDRNGKKANPEQDYDFNPAGYLIHSAVLKARPDVNCVIHHHSIAGMAIGALADGLLPVSQHAMQFYGRVGYHDYNGFGTSLEDECSRIAKDLADNTVLFMRNHGVVVCGEDVGQTFCRMDDLEKACSTQLAILSTTGARHIPSAEIASRTAGQFITIGRPGGETEWPAMRRLLDRLGRNYAC